MTRTIYDVLEELKADFRDLNVYLNSTNNLKDEDLKRIVKNLINEWLIPELKELSDILD